MINRLLFAAIAAIMAVGVMAQESNIGKDEDPLSYTYTKRPMSYTLVKESATSGYITRCGNTYMLGNQAMRGSEYSAFLQQNCRPAYIKYVYGHRTATAGWSLLGCGAGLCGLGWLLASGVTGDGLYTGVYMAYVGGLSMTASVPTLIVGYCRMHDSADMYNASCANKTAAYWSVNIHPDGVGLALNF